MQAWGLLELQRGNVLAAVLLLERCVANDPRCSPVLKWKAVRVHILLIPLMSKPMELSLDLLA